ncbi:MAG TPA: hypothetical protein VJ596_01880, partial [Gemmatimonadaceae bacterium]|nr:hypothetical protein [Gemmatimonadaceae bacterium]
RWLVRLARSVGQLIERAGSVKGEVPVVTLSHLAIAHEVYGGAYGRVLPAGTEAAAHLHGAFGARLDDTYSAKALVAAVALARRERRRVLYWLTFDGRWMAADGQDR